MQPAVRRGGLLVVDSSQRTTAFLAAIPLDSKLEAAHPAESKQAAPAAFRFFSHCPLELRLRESTAQALPKYSRESGAQLDNVREDLIEIYKKLQQPGRVRELQYVK